MSNWFSMQPADQPLEPAKKVFVTGAAGRIGSRFAAEAHKHFELTLMAAPDENTSAIKSYGKVVHADLSEKDRLVELMQGHDGVVHLAATPDSNSTWDQLLGPNVIGCYHGFAAAHEAGVKRVVYASSVHAVGASSREHQVQPEECVMPGNLYGAAKAFGEALAPTTAKTKAWPATRCASAGTCPRASASRAKGGRRTAPISTSDLNQIFRLCLQTRTVRFAIVQALSRNDYDRMCTTQLCELLGYEPQDDFRQVRK